MQDAYLKNVNIAVTDGGYFAPDTATDWRIETHAAAFGKLYYIKEGACRITIEGRTYEGTPGSLFLIPAGARHSYRLVSRPFVKYWMHFSAVPEGELVPCGGQYLVHPDPAVTDAAFARFASLWGEKNAAALLGIRSAAYEILSLYWRAADPEGVIGALPVGRLGEALRAIEARLAAPLTNERLADLCHMHPTSFTRYFKAQTGYTPQGYIKKLRMEHAGELLRTSRLFISEVAERVGFLDGMYFAKAFKKYYSLTPTEYRRLYGT